MRGAGCFKESTLVKIGENHWKVVWPEDAPVKKTRKKSRKKPTKRVGRLRQARDASDCNCTKCGAEMSINSKFLTCKTCRDAARTTNKEAAK